jgi:hypothetical protein
MLKGDVMHTCTQICIIYIYIHTHTHTHMYIYIHVYMEQHHDLNGFCEPLTFQVTPINVRFEVLTAVLLNVQSCGLGRSVD